MIILVRAGALIILSFMFLGAILTGCHLVEVNMVQRSIVDVGDGTTDGYSNAEKEEDKEEVNMKFAVPLK
jgi:hypothetical protein